MSYVMKVIDGQPVGLPLSRPATVTLESGHVVGCAHWSDAELAGNAGLWPVAAWHDHTHRPLGGGTMADGVVLPALEPQPPEYLAARKVEAKAAIRSAASAARDSFRTPGKDAVYLTKLTEGRAWYAAGQPDGLADYPSIAAEVGVTAPTAAALVALWEAMNDIWTKRALPAIEGAEQRALKAVTEATTVDQVMAAQAVAWPSPEDFA